MGLQHVSKRRPFKPAGCGIDDRVGSDHRRASDELVRCTTVIAAQLTCRKRLCLAVSGGRLRMARKALESFLATWYPLSTYPWDRGAKSSTASEQVASWLSGYQCGVQHDRPLQGCSAVRAEETGDALQHTGNNCSSHLGGHGEPRGATRDPQGRPPRRPDGPDDEGVARRHVPARERG